MNVVRTIRNNWKKSLFAVVAGVWGVKYADQKLRDWNLMKFYCIEAKKYGSIILKNTNRPKRVAVILNPAANKGKGRSLYEKNVAPILHLAGLEVTLYVTQFEGQAKKLINEVEQADAIIVAGGDGTLSEVVTGMMKRPDESVFSKTPICIVPLGKTNSLAKQLYMPAVQNIVQFIAEMAFTSVDGSLKYVDVLSVKGGDDKSVYAVSNLSLGLFTDSEIRKKRNWYFGPLKDRICYITTALRYWSEYMFSDVPLLYTSPCQGCNKCKELPAKIQYRWWNLFIRPQYKTFDKDYTNVTNELCGVNNDLKVNISQMDVLVNHQANTMNVHLTSNDLNKFDFIQRGWNRMNNSYTDVGDSQLNAGSLLIQVQNKYTDRKLIIDSEQYELMPTLSLQVLSSKLKFYLCSNNRIAAPESRIFNFKKINFLS